MNGLGISVQWLVEALERRYKFNIVGSLVYCHCELVIQTIPMLHWKKNSTQYIKLNYPVGSSIKFTATSLHLDSRRQCKWFWNAFVATNSLALVYDARFCRQYSSSFIGPASSLSRRT